LNVVPAEESVLQIQSAGDFVDHDYSSFVQNSDVGETGVEKGKTLKQKVKDAKKALDDAYKARITEFEKQLQEIVDAQDRKLEDKDMNPAIAATNEIISPGIQAKNQEFVTAISERKAEIDTEIQALRASKLQAFDNEVAQMRTSLQLTEDTVSNKLNAKFYALKNSLKPKPKQSADAQEVESHAKTGSHTAKGKAKGKQRGKK